MLSFWDKQEVINETQKNKREKIVTSKCERQDKSYIDFRIHVDKDGEYIPTAKGFNLEVEKIENLVNDLTKVLNNKE